MTQLTTTGQPLIIEAPQRRSRAQKIGNAVLTTAFWGVWIILWRPLVGLIGWWTGAFLLWDEFVTKWGFEALSEVLWWYGMIIAGIGTLMLVWVAYNLTRFQGSDRRQKTPKVSLEQTAEWFHVEPDDLKQWREARILTIFHDAAGQVTHVNAARPVGEDGQIQLL